MPRSRPPVSGTGGSSAVGLSPLRPGALGSQTPARRFAEAAIGSGSVGSRRFGSVGRRRRAMHRRTTRAPERTAPRPPLERSGGRSAPDDTPCTPSGHDQTCPGPVTVGTPVRPPRGSFVRSNRAARDPSYRAARPRRRMAILNSRWTTITYPVPPRRRDPPRPSPRPHRPDHGRLLGSDFETTTSAMQTLTVAIGGPTRPGFSCPSRRTSSTARDAGRLALESPAPGHPLRAATGLGAGQIRFGRPGPPGSVHEHCRHQARPNHRMSPGPAVDRWGRRWRLLLGRSTECDVGTDHDGRRQSARLLTEQRLRGGTNGGVRTRASLVPAYCAAARWGGPWTHRSGDGSTAGRFAQTSKKTRDTSSTEALVPLVVSVNTMLL